MLGIGPQDANVNRIEYMLTFMEFATWLEKQFSQQQGAVTCPLEEELK